MREAISFGRFSAKGKQEEGDSLRRQQAAYERVCSRHSERCQPSTRFGFGHFFGHGESGFHAVHLKKGGSLRVLLDMMKSGEIDPGKTVLIIEAFDRLGRIEPDLAIGLLSDIVRSGCPIAVDSPDLWIEPADLGGHKFILIAAMCQLAYSESKQKSERLKAAWDARGKKKQVRTTVCPRWLRFVGGRFVIIPEKAEVVQRVFTSYVDGIGGRTLARTLNEEGVPCLSGKEGKHWDQEAIRFILKSRTVLGEHQPKERVKGGGRRMVGQPIIGYYPSVISDELFWKAQGCLSQRRRFKGRNQHDGVNIFRGLLTDSVSRSPMIIQNRQGWKGSRYKYLVPNRAVADGAGWVAVPYHLLEIALVEFLRELVIAPTSDTNIASRIQAEETLILDLTARLDRINLEQDIESLIPLVRQMTASRTAAEARLSLLKQTAAQKADDDVSELRGLAQQWNKHADAGTLDAFREVVRNKLPSVVESMWCLTIPHNKMSATTVVQIFLRAGGMRWLVVRKGKDGYIATALDGEIDPATDLRRQ